MPQNIGRLLKILLNVMQQFLNYAYDKANKKNKFLIKNY